MSILIARSINEHILMRGLGDSVVYRPDLASDNQVHGVLLEHKPEVLILQDQALDGPVLAAWQQVMEGRPLAVIMSGTSTAWTEFASRSGIAVHPVDSTLQALDCDIEMLRLAEHHLAYQKTLPLLRKAGVGEHPSGLCSRNAVLVGAGIVNLMTAVELARAGYQLTVIDAAPDPRTKPDWHLLGTTHGGGDARMVSLTEADNYNEKGSLIYPGMSTAFRSRISEGGWLARPLHDLTPAEQWWLEQYHAVPAWMAEVFSRDIFAVNREAVALWQELIRECPWLFQNSGYVQDILRIYSEPSAYEAAVSLQSGIGALKRHLPGAEVGRHHPAFADACASGEIVGGFDAVGFTVNIHHFSTCLIGRLEELGVRFSWNLNVRGISWGEDGLVEGLHTSVGMLRADHYVVSPGSNCPQWLAGTLSEDKIQSVGGLWLTLPNLEPLLRHSVKLHREGHVAEDSNITIASDEDGKSILLLGSGYAFVGNGKIDMASPEIEILFQGLEETARRFLRRNYAQALADGSLQRSRKACVRPFTATGLGIFEVLGTADGGRMVITTGHNTGGFTQSPVVAQAARASLEGRFHPMQHRYHPLRGISSPVAEGARSLCAVVS